MFPYVSYGLLLATCWSIFKTVTQAITLPNATILPTDFGAEGIQTMIEHLGLIYESYKVVTQDGYILNLNRMVNPDLNGRRNKGIPVLFVNGLMGHSDGWLLLQDPALNIPVRWLLEGYDVWLGDQRGSMRSLNHISIDVASAKFWDFSFHETGYYDVPAFIDFILRKTGHSKLAYSGLSDGGAFFYVLASTRPEYQKKLFGAVLWVPVGEAGPIKKSMNLLQYSIYKMVNAFVVMYRVTAKLPLWPGELNAPVIQLLRKVFATACSTLVPSSLRRFFTRTIFGKGCQFEANPFFETKRFCFQFATYMGGTSTKTALHTLQLLNIGGIFRQYDYGAIRNILRYGLEEPPVYNITNLRIPTALFYSDVDIFITPEAVESFARKFSYPAYKRKLKGVCHLFPLMDVRMKPVLGEATRFLNKVASKAGLKGKQEKRKGRKPGKTV